MFNKRGVVSTVTFSLIILLLLLILGFSFNYYTDSKLETQLIVKEQELQYSLGSFRAEIINLISYENSNLTYISNVDSQNIAITLINNTITGKEIFNNNKVVVSISSMGIDFCDDYLFYPNTETQFVFNGSCISIVT